MVPERRADRKREERSLFSYIFPFLFSDLICFFSFSLYVSDPFFFLSIFIFFRSRFPFYFSFFFLFL